MNVCYFKMNKVKVSFILKQSCTSSVGTVVILQKFELLAPRIFRGKKLFLAQIFATWTSLGLQFEFGKVEFKDRDEM